MKKKNFKVKYISLCLIFVFLIFLFFTLSVTFLYLGYSNKKIIKVDYRENSTVDYKVFLKENNFFEEEYLTEKDEKPFITSLINNINVLFNYNIQFDNTVEGTYNYEIKAIIEAKAQGSNKKYWEEEYEIIPSKEVKLDTNTSFSILENVDIDYEKYNSRFTDFKKELTKNLSLDGELKIVLNVESKLNTPKLTKSIEKDSTVLMQIPLSQLAVEAKIDTKNSNGKINSIVEIEKLTDTKFLVYKITGILSGVFGIISLIYFIKLIRFVHNQTRYELTLKRILRNYDSIIVNINEYPDFGDLNVIYVKSFEELIDAHGEVRMPINYYEDEACNRGIFVLINDPTAWVYILDSYNFKNNK